MGALVEEEDSEQLFTTQEHLQSGRLRRPHLEVDDVALLLSQQCSKLGNLRKVIIHSREEVHSQNLSEI